MEKLHGVGSLTGHNKPTSNPSSNHYVDFKEEESAITLPGTCLLGCRPRTAPHQRFFGQRRPGCRRWRCSQSALSPSPRPSAAALAIGYRPM